MSWSEKYKKSINCDNPKGFSQRAHCQGKKKKMNEEKKKDHEYSMARSEIKTINNATKRLQKKMGKKGKPMCRGWHDQKPREVDIVVRVKNGLENEEKQGAKYCDIGFIAERDKDGNITGMQCVGDEYALKASNYPNVTGEVSNKTEKIAYYGKQALRAYRESDVCRKFNRNRTLRKRNKGKNWRRGQFKTVTKNGKKVRALVVNQ